MLDQINEVAVVVSAILCVAIGSIWYSPLVLGGLWIRAVGSTVPEVSQEENFFSIGKGIVAHILFSAVIAVCIQISIVNTIPLVHMTVLLSLFLVAYMVSTVAWEKHSFVRILINAGYGVLTTFVSVGIIAYWPW